MVTTRLAGWRLGLVGLQALLAGGIPATACGGDDIDGSNVYQRVKDADEHGLSVRRFAQGQDDSGADIVLDEQGAARGGRGNDPAMRPLFRRVDKEKLKSGTYPEFVALLDNYVVRSKEEEEHDDEEQQEIDRFVDEAVAGAPMRVAYAYVTDELGQDLSEAEFREAVEAIWFTIYTNHFGGKKTPFCSGFEHVFVGEGNFGPQKGEVTGYHSWVKFLRDEEEGLVDYLGTKYDLPANRMPSNPGVITLQMIWDHDEDGDGGDPPVELFKKKGGFFVGTSPECELALGTVAYYELQEGLLTDDTRRVVLDGATYDLVLHANVEEGGRRGEFVRSFFPILVGRSRPVDDVVEPGTDGPVAIVRSLPNPQGDDETGEWVELTNGSDADVDLEGWELRDRQGGSRALEGTLAAGETRRFEIPRDSHTMRLGNGGGVIRLVREAELVDEVRYGQAGSGEVIAFED